MVARSDSDSGASAVSISERRIVRTYYAANVKETFATRIATNAQLQIIMRTVASVATSTRQMCIKYSASVTILLTRTICGLP